MADKNPSQEIKPPKPSLAEQLGGISKLLKSNLSSIVIVLVIAILGYAFITVNSILSQSDDDDYRQAQSEKGVRSSFDQSTIDKINNLRSSSDSSTIDLPQGRINPFVE